MLIGPKFSVPSRFCAPNPLGDEHTHNKDDAYLPGKGGGEPPLQPSKVGVSEQLRHEVIDLTQKLVQINSGPDNLIAGEKEVVAKMSAYALEAGLEVQSFPSDNGKPMLIITLPGTDPAAGSIGFVHHTDVVQPEGEWKLGEPFSGKITKDEMGRDIMVGRGTVDTKGPAVQILAAMKHLKQTGAKLDRSMKLFMFPDEEFGGKDGAWTLSRKQPELFQDVRYWVVEGSGIFAPDFMGGQLGQKDVPYLAVAQKYTVPMQLELKEPTSADQAVHKTLEALDRADKFVAKRDWTYLGNKAESKEAMKRMGDAVGGFKGFMIKHFWNWGFMQKQMGTGNAAANRSDFCKTDFYLSNNPSGIPVGPNVKPSSATMVLKLDLAGADRDKAFQAMQSAAGETMKVVAQDDGSIRLSLPQENYHGGNHGSTADRKQDAIDVTDQALGRIEKSLAKQGWADKLQVTDVFTSKSAKGPGAPNAPVTSRVTLDLRVSVDEDPRKILQELADAAGPEFVLKPIMGPEELDAKVRRLNHNSPLFQAAEASIHSIYGGTTPVLFGNTTASNDTRFLMETNPECETLTFVPVLYTKHGAHGPDEAVTVNSLAQGVDWVVDLSQRLGNK